MENSLTDAELAVFDTVKAVMQEKTKIPCTGCGYCMPCPHGVNIPGCFAAYNAKYLLEDKNSRFKYIQTLGALSKQPAYASMCKECGKCEKHCPQHIEIRKELKQVKKEMEGKLFQPIVKIGRFFARVK